MRSNPPLAIGSGIRKTVVVKMLDLGAPLGVTVHVIHKDPRFSFLEKDFPKSDECV